MDPKRVTSLSLLDRARHHDEPSWRRLVTLYGPLVEHWCRRGGARPEDAADLAQEVFLAVSQGLERFERRGPGSFRGWVRGITRHKLLDCYRRTERQAAAAGGSTALERLLDIPDPQPSSDEDADEMSGLYRRALDLIRGEFEERTWQAFWLTAVEGREAPAAAAELGMSPVAVRIARSRVLARLRAEADELID
jgi:RNA polymerase sigma-70 factor (ECF subfamily)